MTMPYQMPVAYNQVGLVQPTAQKQKDPAIKAGIAGASIGAVAGTVEGFRTNPYIGQNSENFAKKVYEIWINKTDDGMKEIHNQGKKILNKIKRIKTTADLRALFDSNKEIATKYCESLDISVDDLFKSMSERTLKDNKEEVVTWIKNNAKERLLPIKNWIDKSYDQAQKTFTQLPEMSQEIFDSIQTASKTGKGLQVIKKAGIFGAIGAVAGFALYKGYQILKNVRAQKAQEKMINNQ